MSGGGGGGDGSHGKNTAGGTVNPDGTISTIGKAGGTPYTAGPSMRTFGMMPGQNAMIGSQLANGFGQGGFDFTALLNSLYKPAQVMNYQQPITQTVKQFDPKKMAMPSTGNPYLDQLFAGKQKLADVSDKDDKKK